MTLTRAPCELEKMSLFQDLKLKRRKVDSRCSSDGESVADTSTSSPDLVCPASPKLESAPSPDSTPGRIDHHPNHHHHHQQQQQQQLPPPQPSTPTSDAAAPPPPTSAAAQPDETAVVFDGGGTQDSGAGVIRATAGLRSQSPPAQSTDRHVHLHHHQQQQQQQQQQPPRPHSSPLRHRVPPSGNTPGVITSSPHHAAHGPLPPHFWTQGARINGVKPELIGGGDMKPPASSVRGSTMSGGVQSATPTPRPAPTVIMGEAGGVRTMVWSQPAAPPPTLPQVLADQHASTSSSLQWSPPPPPGAPANPEESAAQMLLHLGQEVPRRSGGPGSNLGHHHHHHQQQQQQQQQQQAARVGGGAPAARGNSSSLNMERLWAGDLTQLPASQQQLHALNLSPAAGGGDGTQTTVTPPSHHSPQQQHQHHQHHHHHQVKQSESMMEPTEVGEEEEQPMVCMICEDRATGLHYGIITCEGCKGFFKRTVQNRRVYTCVADGECEITKAQRNRCQYCRFKKCIEQGMVLQAVREDRMPGGRNSGAVYNLYKVKYKKHKKSAAKQHQQAGGGVVAGVTTVGNNASITAAPHYQQQQQQHQLLHHQQQQQQQQKGASSAAAAAAAAAVHLVNGTILKTALTNPSEVVHLRQRLECAVSSSSRDRALPADAAAAMIRLLVECDEFEDIATLHNLDELLDHKSDLSEKLCQIGDSIVYKLVQWTKRLPFYLELPVEVHTRLLTHKWHELLVLTTSAYQAIHGSNLEKGGDAPQQQSAGEAADELAREVALNLGTLQSCLTCMMGRPITMDQLRQDVGLMVEKITHVTLMFRRIRLTMEEYVCLKVITMLSQAGVGSAGGGGGGGGNGAGQRLGGNGSGAAPPTAGNAELESIQDRYMACLRAYTQSACPQQPARFHELLVRLPEVQTAAALLLESKMFYVPFLLNSAIQR